MNNVHVNFLLGPAGSGKTFRCLAEIRAALMAAPEGLPLVFLAPKQATFQLEQELLADPELPGYTRLQILSFERLAGFLLNQFFPAPPRLLSEEGRVMVLRALLARKYEELKLFHASARLPGFARQLSSLLNELQQHQLSPERLLKLADPPSLHFGAVKDSVAPKLPAKAEEDSPNPQLQDKLHDLALLLRAYLDWLKANELQDPNGQLELAAAAVKDAARESQFRLGGLWLDGFAELTPQELDLLAGLIPQSERVTLAFCLDAEPEQGDDWHSMWATINRTFRRCVQRLEILPGFKSTTTVLERHPTKNRFAASPTIAHLERCWVQPQPFTNGELSTLNVQPSTFNSLEVFACADPEGEAVVAAREILKHVREGKGRFRDVAVLVRSLDDYERVLSRVFTRYGIRFFIDRREPVSHHPLAELTRYALRVLISNWEHDDWFGALKTGLVHQDEAMIDRLENAALARGWRGNVWLKPLRLPNEPDLEKRLEQIRQQIVSPFNRMAESLEAVQRQPTGVELAAAIRALWQELGVEEKLQEWSEAAASSKGDSRDSFVQAEIHAQTWQEMEKWLDNLELAFEKTLIPLGDWISVVEAGLANLTVGVIPLALDEVVIGQVDRSRNPNLEMALLLGLNEMVFPAAPPAPLLLSQSDRETLSSRGLMLGLDQRGQIGHERLLGYIACTRARRRLVLTCAHQNLNGQPLNPSPFIHHLQRLFPGLEPEPAGDIDWRQSVHAGELVVPLLKNRVQDPDAKIHSLARLEKLPVFAPVLARWDQIGTARSIRRLSPGLADRIYGPELKTSISNLEDYAACPFKFFVVRGLRAEERKEFEADQRERGSFQHEILMEFHRRLQTQGQRWRDLTPDQAGRLLGEIGKEVQRSFREGLFSSRPDRTFMAESLIENLKTFIQVLVGWAPQYLFEPQAVEIGFGLEQDGLKPWRIELGGGHALLLRGRIDRVDLRQQANDEAYAVVIDYKSSGQELEQVKLVNGLDLQLLAYLGVLRDAANAKAVFGASKLAPAGGFYVGLRNASGSGKNRMDVLEDAQAARQAAYQHRGRFRADLLEAFDNRQKPKGDQFRYSRNKDGNFSKVGNEVLPETDFLALVDQIQEFLRRYGQEIYAGDVRIEPFRHKSETACGHCEYRSVCRFDPWLEPYRVLTRGAVAKELEDNA